MIRHMLLFMLEASSRPSKTMTAGILHIELHGLFFPFEKDSLSRLVSPPTLNRWHKMHCERCRSLASHMVFALLAMRSETSLVSDLVG